MKGRAFAIICLSRWKGKGGAKRTDIKSAGRSRRFLRRDKMKPLKLISISKKTEERGLSYLKLRKE